MAVCMNILVVAILVGAWAVGAAPVPDGGMLPPALLVCMSGDKSGLYWWKMTWHRIVATLVAIAFFFPLCLWALEHYCPPVLPWMEGRGSGYGCIIGKCFVET